MNNKGPDSVYSSNVECVKRSIGYSRIQQEAAGYSEIWGLKEAGIYLKSTRKRLVHLGHRFQNKDMFFSIGAML